MTLFFFNVTLCDQTNVTELEHTSTVQRNIASKNTR